MKVDPAGLPSLTHWTVMGRIQAPGAQPLTWLALEPVTGRTHQLRVHCQAMGWPILGDNIYGTAPRFGGPGLHLLSREIVVPLYKNRDPVRVTAPVPPRMHAALTACGWQGDRAATTISHNFSASMTRPVAATASSPFSLITRPFISTTSRPAAVGRTSTTSQLSVMVSSA